MAKKKTQPKPTGLAISRSGLDFTLTWTPMKGSKKQSLKFYLKTKKGSSADNKKKTGWKLIWGGKSNQTISATTKSKKCTLDPDDYFPKTSKTIYSVVFVLKAANSKGKWTNEIQKEYILSKPGTPSYYSPQQYENQEYTYTYAWGRNSKDSNNNKIHFKSFEWQSVLVKSSVASGKKLDAKDWNKCKTQKITTIDATTGATKTNQNSYGTGSSITIVESASVVPDNMRRFVRVRACGAAGWSGDWRYIDHAFGVPDDTSISLASYVQDDIEISGLILFTAPIKNHRPVDNVIVEYAIVKPRTIDTGSSQTPDGYSRTDITLPLEHNWTQYRELGAIGAEDRLAFEIQGHVGDNECLFIRVNSVHDGETRYGDPVLVTRDPIKMEVLSAPELTGATVSQDRSAVSISVNNTTDLENNRSFVAVYFRTDSNTQPEKPIGIIPYGTSQATFKIPSYDSGSSISFGIRAFVADYSPAVYSGELTYFDIINIKMRSLGIVWDNGAVPKPPSKPILSRVKEGVINVSWDWPWLEANSAELSWSDDPDAWMSTNEPQTYNVSNLYSGEWNIAGLSAGTWYVRVRLVRTTDAATIYGTYSDMAEINLSSAPNTPTLTLEPMIVASDGSVNAYWQYSSTDGTGQSYAELAEATLDEGTNTWQYEPLKDAKTNTANHIEFSPSTYAWEDGSEHYISLRVTSGSNISAEWSNPVRLAVATKPVIEVTYGESFAEKEVPIGDSGEDGTRIDFSLIKLPIEFDVSGAGVGGTTTAIITRMDNFDLDRPDDSTEIGHQGETILSYTIQNDSENDDGIAHFSIEAGDASIVGHLDDEAPYVLSISVTDSLGQTVSADPREFHVHWNHQGVIPTANVTIDQEEEIAIIEPLMPESGFAEGDYCQIYRLSADRPQLIVTRAEFGERYVDPYPTFGVFSGYRIVYMTKYDDYRDDNGNLTWVDYEPIPDEDEPQYRIDYLKRFAVVINFDDVTLELPGNVSLSNSWKKDFQVTKYLGGSMEGDWKEGVERSGTYKATIPIEHDREMAYNLRLLADYPDACHIRTPEGSNFYGNVDINEDRSEKWVNKVSSVSLSVTKVDNVSDDGMLYSTWQIEE